MTTREPAIVLTLMLLAGFSAGCGDEGPPSAGPQRPPMSAEAFFDSPEAGFSLRIPRSWQGGYRIEELHGRDAEAVLPRARHAVTFHYVPLAGATAERPLLRILVFSPEDWRAIVAQPGPPFGGLLAERDDRAWVVALPQANPYDPGSADAKRFQSMTPSFEQIRDAFALR